MGAPTGGRCVQTGCSERAAASGERHGGPPYFWFAEVASPASGTWQAMLVRNEASGDCRTVTREIVVQIVGERRLSR